MAHQDDPSHYLAQTLHALARQLRDKADAHTAGKPQDDVVPISYALGLRDAALFLDQHADYMPTTKPHSTTDFDPWDAPEYNGPSVLSRVHVPGVGDFLAHLPTPRENRHLWEGNWTNADGPTDGDRLDNGPRPLDY